MESSAEAMTKVLEGQTVLANNQRELNQIGHKVAPVPASTKKASKKRAAPTVGAVRATVGASESLSELAVELLPLSLSSSPGP